MAIMDVIGHEHIDTTRLYNHSGLEHIREAMNKRNVAMQ
jgi:hypothetical protein